jgi:hypothetical protein
MDLAREQKQTGHDPSICCIVRGGPLAQEPEPSGIPVNGVSSTSVHSRTEDHAQGDRKLEPGHTMSVMERVDPKVLGHTYRRP